MPVIENMNLMAILAAAIAGMVIGMIWYSPAVLGNAWIKALDKTRDQLGPPAPAMIGSMISTLVTAFALEFLVIVAGADNFLAGAGLGLVIGLGVVAMTMLSDSLFSGWSWPLYFIQTGYRILAIIVMGAICGAWPNPSGA